MHQRRLTLTLITVSLLFAAAFTARPTQPPPIRDVSPLPGATDVWLGTSVQIQFDAAMDRAGVETRFGIEPDVAGTFVWQSSGNGDRVEFRPFDILTPSTTYTITLAAGVEDADGSIVLDTDYVWPFTTIQQPDDIVDFGGGLAVQLVDPAGRRRVQLWAGYPRIRMDFTLYALPEAEFIARYVAGSFEDHAPIDVSGLEPVTDWQAQYVDDDGYTLREAELPIVDPGVYVLVAQHPSAGQDELVVIVSNHVLALKRGAGGQVVAWATLLQDRTSAPGMTVTLYNGNGAAVAAGATGADGRISFVAMNDARLAIGRLGDEMTVAGLDGVWRSRDGTWYWWEPEQANDDYQVYLHTDRPIYRPGDSIQFAAILRTFDGMQTANPYAPVAATQTVTVALRDSRNNVVDTLVFAPDDFGSVRGAFRLGLQPPMGTYQIELAIDGTIQRQTLRVEAYRKPEFQATVETGSPFVIAGDEVQLTVAADYYFGQPVAGADVVVKVYRSSSWWYGWPDSGQIDELRGVTDSTGRWRTTFGTDGTYGADSNLTFVAEVTDASQQPVEGRQSLPVYWSDFSLDVSTASYDHAVDEPVVVDVTLMQHDGAPVAGQSVHVSVDRGYWRESEVVAAQDIVTDVQGRAAATFNEIPAGWYRIRATAMDGRGRAVESVRYIWIFDPDSQTWWYSSGDDLSIAADRAGYAPGDIARLIIESRITGAALLTVERDTVLHTQVVELDGPATIVELDLTADFAPNIFVRVHIFTTDEESYPYYYTSTPEGRLLVAQVELPVAATGHGLDVSITPDTDVYRPDDRAEFTVQTLDAGGAPVEAQVSLAVIDEAIFALSEDLTADIFEAFWGSRTNHVSTFDSLAPQRTFYSRGVPEWDGGAPTPSPSPTGTPAPAAPSEETGQPVRQEFRDTAYWNADIRTDGDGIARVSVDLPDNLTTWRVTARAVTVDTQVGESSTSILVTQDIVNRPALPRFAVRGDRLSVAAIAQNFTAQPTTGTATLDAPGLVVLDPGPRPLELDSVGTDVARWTAVVAEVGENRLTSTVDTLAGSDSVELPLRTVSFAVPDRQAAAGQADPVATEDFEVPFNAVHEATQLTIRLSPSVAIGLLDGLDELIDYPYGCVEQTMSRVLPSAAAANAYAALNIPNPKADVLPEIVQQGLQRLYGFQHADGSWGWWYDDEGGIYMTAYVLFGLTTVQQAGFEVDAKVLDRGFAFLDSRLPQVDDARIGAYAHYVKSSAGRGDLAAARALLTDQAKLDTFARAVLALTLEREGDPAAAQQLADRLLATVVETSTTAYWPAESMGTDYHWRTMASQEKNTATALYALAELRAEASVLPKIARWLMLHRRGSGWGDTQATAFAVLGLSRYILLSGELEPDYTYAVRLNETVLGSGQVTPEDATMPIEPITVPGSALRDGANTVSIERNGNGQLYYTLVLELELFYDDFEPVSSVDRGFSLHREYRLAEPSSAGDDGYRVGDLVEVVLTLDADGEAWYIILEDPLPAGFEALNERMNPVSYGDFLVPHLWREWGYNRKDIYDDQVAFFITHLWPGEHTFTYLMRATTSGEFSALPAQAYPMYAAGMWGRSASQRVAVSQEMLAPRPALVGDFDRDCRVSLFDARQAAGAWGTVNALRDLDADADVDLHDVAAVAARRGAVCGSDRPLPGTRDTEVGLTLVAQPDTIAVGDTFDVDVLLNDRTEVGGFALTANYDPDLVQPVSVELSKYAHADTAALASSMPPLVLPTRIDRDTGTISFGALDLSGIQQADGVPATIATVKFVARRTGTLSLTPTNVQAVDSVGGSLIATASPIELEALPSQVYLALIGR